MSDKRITDRQKETNPAIYHNNNSLIQADDIYGKTVGLSTKTIKK